MSIPPKKQEKNQIIYYSKYCEHSNKLLKILSKTDQIKEKIHFLPIDRRKIKEDNRTYVVLDNGQEILMPDVIKQVPALLLLHYGNRTLFGEEILKFYRPQIDKERKSKLQWRTSIFSTMKQEHYVRIILIWTKVQMKWV